MQPVTSTVCARHPRAEAVVRCQRCERPICSACMVDAPVGFQCPDCTRAAAPSVSLPFGGQRSRDPRLTTIALIVVNALVFLATFATRNTGHVADVLALMPAGRCESVSDPMVYYPGVPRSACSMDGAWLAGQSTGAPWQVVTSAFTHVSVVHLLMNMLTLWILGPTLESVLGRLRFLGIYATSALAGSAMVMWAASVDVQTLGASGAIFGLLATWIVVALKAGGNATSPLMWLLVNIAVTFTPGAHISWQGHVGGLIGGALAAAAIVWAPRSWRGWRQALLVGLICLVSVGLIVARMMQLA